MAEPLLVDRLQSPIGEVVVVADREGRLRAVDFADHTPRLERTLQRRHGEVSLKAARDPGGLAGALARYFMGELGAIDGLPTLAGGSPFQQAVWDALVGIPCGSTVTYGEIARRIGRPAAVRAVGLANGSNPIAVVVPCHRVIGSGGALTGYGGGLDRKRWLLAHEGVESGC